VAATEAERAHDIAMRQLRAATAAKAEAAAGIGATDGEEHEVADRDANGRRLWEAAPMPQNHSEAPADPTPGPAKDVTGQIGLGLDLCG
jgi:hypothetical protein